MEQGEQGREIGEDFKKEVAFELNLNRLEFTRQRRWSVWFKAEEISIETMVLWKMVTS